MTDKETLIRFISALGENLVYNLDFIPTDKFDWKPAPTAKSALEIVNHMLENFNMANGAFGDDRPIEPVHDVESAKQGLRSAYHTYERNLRDANRDKLMKTIEAGTMTLSLNFLAQMVVSETIHHHGQIAYIQSLLGDEESHFSPEFFKGLQ